MHHKILYVTKVLGARKSVMEFVTVSMVVGHNCCRIEKNFSPDLAKTLEGMKTD